MEEQPKEFRLIELDSTQVESDSTKVRSNFESKLYDIEKRTREIEEKLNTNDRHKERLIAKYWSHRSWES